jgi:hypothetical protein
VPFRYATYESCTDLPNVVLDGSPNPATTLTLTHWPGFIAPAHLADDLSAQMAFRYLDSDMSLHGDAELVTNNHFDQDGLVSIFAFTNPDVARPNRALLEDVAAAGDFGTYKDRRAARMSMVISAWGMAAPDPFVASLERLPHLIEDVDAHRELWDDEDRRLTESEAAVAAGEVKIVDEPDLDIAIVTVDPDVGPWWGRRFTGQRFDGVHPMAVNNTTDMSGLALVHGRTYRYTHRYETWVQYKSRERRQRVKLRPLATRLTELDDVAWHAEAVGSLTPTLTHEGPSSLTAEQFLDELRRHLRTAEPAWDPRLGRSQVTV